MSTGVYNTPFMSLSDFANEINFSDVTYFCKVLKSTFGIVSSIEKEATLINNNVDIFIKRQKVIYCKRIFVLLPQLLHL